MPAEQGVLLSAGGRVVTLLPWVCPSAGPDVNPALVLEQKQAAEVAAARTAACLKHSSPTCLANGTYINGSFEHPAENAGAGAGSGPLRQ